MAMDSFCMQNGQEIPVIGLGTYHGPGLQVGLHVKF